jgi:hypothetical protein
MANYVNTNVYFEEISEAGSKVLADIFARVRQPTEEFGRLRFEDVFVDGKEGSPTYDDVNTYDFMAENVGPKWCYFEDMDTDSFTTYSAWTWPQEGVEWIVDQVAKIDPNVIAVVTYEDEMPNFIGAAVYTAEGLYESFEDDGEEIQEFMKERHPELAEHWDEEEQWFDEEGNEIYSENLPELIEEIQSSFVEDIVADIRSSRLEEY